MEVSELEEGEARFDYNDVAFSYIDTRLENVLGHFQRDFDGLFSAETLGPKFGLYGSFLPTQRHPPIVPSHTKPPQNALNSNKPPSCYNFQLKAASINSVTPVSQHTGVFVDPNALSANDSASKDTSKNETTTSNLAIPNKQRSLKLRIKIGCDKIARKKDELYSGLGLSTSSSSTGNDPEDSGGPPIDSPSSILRDMTSIFVPENCLLSPLNESLLCLIKTVRKTSSSFFVDDSSSVLGERKQMEVSSQDKSVVLERIKTESLDSKQGLTNDFKVKLSSNSIRYPVGMLNVDVSTSKANEAAKKLMPLKKRETKRDLIKDQLFGPDFTSEESNVVKDLKNDPEVSKHEMDRFEKKVGPKATTRESQEVKVSNYIDKFPSERKNKLMGVQSNGISSFKKENLSSGLCGPMKDKKSVVKDIVKVRNSYKDILDTRVEDQNKQTKPLDMFTSNEAIKEQNIEKIGIPAEVPVPQITEVAPALSSDNWVGCDRCQRWRLLPIGIEPDNLPDKWLCSMLTWLPGRNRCDISEEETTKAVQDMNLRLISQNQDSLQANIGHHDLTNMNLVPENLPNRFLKNKSRPEGSSSSMIETSHSSLDAREKKRKSFGVENQPLVEKNVVNQPIIVKVNGKDVNGGDLSTKKLKSKAVSNQYETVTLNKIKTESESEQLYVSNGDHRPKDKLVISVKRGPDNTEVSMKSKLLDKKVEMPAKKRKWKDWEESQPCENTLACSEDKIERKEKRLKVKVKEESTDDKPFNTGKSMKIRLSVSKENLVNISHEKNQQHKVSSFPIRATNLHKMSSAARKTISRKSQSQSQRFCDEVEVKHTEKAMSPGKGSLSRSKDNDEKVNIQRVKITTADPLTGKEPFSNKVRKVEVVNDERQKYSNESSAKISNDVKSVGKKVSRRRTSDSIGDEKPTTSLTQNTQFKSNLGDMGSSGVNPTLKIRDLKVLQPKVEDSANQNDKRLVTDCGTMKDLSVTSYLKEYASSQTAMSAYKRAEESKDYADRLKISGFDYECNDAYFDSALKFLYAASLLEASTADFSKLKGVDPMNGYRTSAKLSKICAQEYEKREEMATAVLAYKCIEVACMKIVYCKSLLTRQDLQISMQLVTQGESPSSSASDVDNLNNQSTTDKTILPKSIVHLGNQVVARNHAISSRLLEFTSDVNLAMEASIKSQNAYKATNAILEQTQNKEMIVSVKRVADFSFQDVKELVCLVQNARETINRQGFKGSNRQ